MTLIVAALTKKKGFLFGDKTRTISPENGNPVQIKMGGIRITTTGNVYWQNSGTKIHSLHNNSIHIGIAGSEDKAQKFLQSLDADGEIENFSSHINQYWLKYGDESPDQMIFLSKKGDMVYAESYFKYNEPRFNSYVHYTYEPKDDKLLFVAIGSGSQPFLGYAHILNDDLENQYNDALKGGTTLEWGEKLVKKVKSIYIDIHHQIDSVGEEVDVVEI